MRVRLAILGRAETRSALTAFGFIVALGFADGGFHPAAWGRIALALCAVAALELLLRARIEIDTVELAALCLLAALVLLTVLSGTWGIAGSEPTLEAERALVYLAGLLAFVLVIERGAEEACAGGCLAGIVVVCSYALLERATHPQAALNPFEGALLFRPIGYSNALGLIAAVGALLACGFAASDRAPVVRMLASAAGVIAIAALTLTESRGAWLALGVGLVAALLLLRAEPRLLTAVLSLTPLALLAAVLARRSSGLWLVPAVFLPAAAAAAPWLPSLRIGRRARLAVGLAGLLAAALAAVFLRPSITLGDRGHYWHVALQDGRAHPLLGSGAGSFATVWFVHRPVAVSVRDAHSLYLESFAELGAVGLALICALLCLPLLAVARRRNGTVIAAVAGAYIAFLVHAGLDWDWEMPVVTLCGLACGTVLLVTVRPTQLNPLSRTSQIAVAGALALVAGLSVATAVAHWHG